MSRRAFIALVLTGHLGCSVEQAHQPVLSTIVPEGPSTIAEVFGAGARTVLLEQTRENYLVGFGGADIDSAGALLWADPSEGNVKWFDADGTLKMIVGRKGHGPGEFMNPFFPRFGQDGLIHIIDLGSGVITRFDSAGVFVNRTGPVGISPIGGMATLPSGGYVVTGFSRTSDERNVVHILRDDGSVSRSLLPIRDVIPDGTQLHPVWDNLRTFHMAFEPPNVHVTAALSDSLWTIDITSGIHSARSVHVPGRIPISAPLDGAVNDVTGLVTWAGQHRFAYIPVVAGNNVVLSFMRGQLLDGLDVIQLIEDDRGSWWHLMDRSIVIAGGRDWIVGVQGHTDSLRATYYRRGAAALRGREGSAEASRGVARTGAPLGANSR
jgi:hypothetical protein